MSRHDLQRALLGVLLTYGPRALSRFGGDRDLFSGPHGELYGGIVEVITRDGALDLVELMSVLGRHGSTVRASDVAGIICDATEDALILSDVEVLEAALRENRRRGVVDSIARLLLASPSWSE